MMTVTITHKSVAQSVAQHFEKMDEGFLHSFMQHFQQHFESVTQHFFMTLKVDIHIIYNVCPILGSYKSVAQHSQWKDTRNMYSLFQSVAQHFESVAQHFFMTLKVDIHIIYNVCPILGTYKSVAQHSRRKDTRIMYPLFQSGFNNFNPNRRRTLTDRPARHVFFLF